MPVIGYVMGPSFGGESAVRDAAFYENSLAIDEAREPLKKIAGDLDSDSAQSSALVRAFIDNAEPRKAVTKVYDTLKEAMIMNQYKDQAQYGELVQRAREWNRMFAVACLTEIPVPPVAVEQSQVQPVARIEAPRPTLIQRAKTYLPTLGR